MKKTHWKKLDNPNYLGAYSLMDGETKEMTVTIQKVVIEEVKTDRGTESCKVAYIKSQKPMILNTTNCKIISQIYESPYIDDWADKQVTLYVAKIKAFGETLDALRIKKEIPKVKKEELTPDHSRWAGAKKAINEGSVTIDQIKKSFDVSQENIEKLCSK